MERLKKIAFLMARPGMSDKAFRLYWRETHGPLVAESPNYGMWRRRYVQNHVVARGPVGQDFPFHGMAEFWLPGLSPNEDAFSATDIYQGRIKVDEENFIDMNGTISMAAMEQVARPGWGRTKLIVMAGRSEATTLEEFEAYNRTALVPALLGVKAFSDRLRGWTLSHMIEGSCRLPGGRTVAALPVDCLHEMWFDSREDLQQAFTQSVSGTFVASIFGEAADVASLSSFVSEEIVFFDADASRDK